MTDPRVIEALLLRWTDSHKGRTVTFQLPDDDGGHPFRGLKCGATNGQRLALSVALIGDDETQQNMGAERGAIAPQDEPLSRETAQPGTSENGASRDVAQGPAQVAAPPVQVSASVATGRSRPTTEAAEEQGQASAKTGRPSLGTARSQECGRFCNDPEFQAFLRHEHRNLWERRCGRSADMRLIAAVCVREILDIDSRRELDTKDGAWQRWCELMSDYACWADAKKRTEAG